MSADPDHMARYLASIEAQKRADREEWGETVHRATTRHAAAVNSPLPQQRPMIATAFQDIVRRIYGERLPYEYLIPAMASALGVQTRAVQRWISGRQPIPPDVAADARALLAIAERRRSPAGTGPASGRTRAQCARK